MATATEGASAVCEDFTVVESDDKRLPTTETTNSSSSRGDRASSKRSDSGSENGKKKPKEEKAPTKVVIRRLPPSMTKDVFINQISPIPEHDYFYFVPGDSTVGVQMGFARAYINFINQEDLLQFTGTYDGYVFVDSKGQEYPAVVEFAPFQRIPKQRTKKKDLLAKSIENDPAYIAFKESLEAAAAEAAKPDVTSKQHFFETDVRSSTQQEVTTTPLLEFLKQKRLDRARIRDEKREERRRKDAERKLRQKNSKEKKIEADEEMKDVKNAYDFEKRSISSPMKNRHYPSRNSVWNEASCAELQLLLPKERKENIPKEPRNGKRVEKEKLKESRPREFRNKNLTEGERARGERRGDRKRTGGAANKDKRDSGSGVVVGRSSAKENKDNTETTVDNSEQTGICEPIDIAADNSEKMGDASEKKRRVGAQRAEREGGGENRDGAKKSSRYERNKTARKERERKRRDEYVAAKKNQERKGATSAAGKSTDSVPSSNTNDEKPLEDGQAADESSTAENVKTLVEGVRQDSKEESSGANERRRTSLGGDESTADRGRGQSRQRRRNSLDSGGGKVNFLSDRKENDRQTSVEDETSARRSESDGGGSGRKKKNKGEDKASRSDQDDKEKDPRPSRRIRNKDRPSIQIYRPGMGKLSKQRLEKKDAMMGSSTEVDSPSHSPSPKLPLS